MGIFTGFVARASCDVIARDKAAMQIVAAGDIGDEIEERILQFLIVIQYGRIAPNFEEPLCTLHA
jgi:hypothetical protein